MGANPNVINILNRKYEQIIGNFLRQIPIEYEFIVGYQGSDFVSNISVRDKSKSELTLQKLSDAMESLKRFHLKDYIQGYEIRTDKYEEDFVEYLILVRLQYQNIS